MIDWLIRKTKRNKMKNSLRFFWVHFGFIIIRWNFFLFREILLFGKEKNFIQFGGCGLVVDCIILVSFSIPFKFLFDQNSIQLEHTSHTFIMFFFLFVNLWQVFSFFRHFPICREYHRIYSHCYYHHFKFEMSCEKNVEKNFRLLKIFVFRRQLVCATIVKNFSIFEWKKLKIWKKNEKKHVICVCEIMIWWIFCKMDHFFEKHFSLFVFSVQSVSVSVSVFQSLNILFLTITTINNNNKKLLSNHHWNVCLFPGSHIWNYNDVVDDDDGPRRIFMENKQKLPPVLLIQA